MRCRKFNVFVLLVAVLSVVLFMVEVNLVPVLFKNGVFMVMFVLVVVPLLIYLLLFNESVGRLIRTQNNSGQRGWFFYLRQALVMAPLLSNLFLFLYYQSSRLSVVYCFFKKISSAQCLLFNNIGLLLVVNFGLVVYFYCLLYLDRGRGFDRWLRFAPGSVGIKGDQYGFSSSASNVATMITNLDKEVNVISIDGGYGVGKSSYLRMIIEHLEAIKDFNFLYTYISLTETNEEEDFSNLFVERWYRTLKENYPVINIGNTRFFKRLILREYRNDWLFLLSSLFSKTSLRINQVRDKNGQLLSPEVTTIFGDLENLTEDTWFIVIDEIDRAKLSEIYRVIETIERFKILASDGFPIKVVFVLCCSTNNLRNNLEVNSELSPLIKSFFTIDSKTIDIPLSIPSISELSKGKVILNELGQIAKSSGYSKEVINTIEELKKEILDPASFKELNDDSYDGLKKDLYQALVIVSSSAGPRDLDRILSTLRFITHQQVVGSKDKKINIADLLVLSFVDIKMPFLKIFFQNTIEDNPFHKYDYYDEQHHQLSEEDGFIKYMLDNTDSHFHQKIKENKSFIISVVKLVANSYLVRARNVNKDYVEQELAGYLEQGSTSHPEIMKQYLSYFSQSKD